MIPDFKDKVPLVTGKIETETMNFSVMGGVDVQVSFKEFRSKFEHQDYVSENDSEESKQNKKASPEKISHQVLEEIPTNTAFSQFPFVEKKICF